MSHVSELLPEMGWVSKEVPLYFATHHPNLPGISPALNITYYQFFSEPREYTKDKERLEGLRSATIYATGFLFGYHAAGGKLK